MKYILDIWCTCTYINLMTQQHTIFVLCVVSEHVHMYANSMHNSLASLLFIPLGPSIICARGLGRPVAHNRFFKGFVWDYHRVVFLAVSLFLAGLECILHCEVMSVFSWERAKPSFLGYFETFVLYGCCLFFKTQLPCITQYKIISVCLISITGMCVYMCVSYASVCVSVCVIFKTQPKMCILQVPLLYVVGINMY